MKKYAYVTIAAALVTAGCSTISKIAADLKGSPSPTATQAAQSNGPQVTSSQHAAPQAVSQQTSAPQTNLPETTTSQPAAPQAVAQPQATAPQTGQAVTAQVLAPQTIAPQAVATQAVAPQVAAPRIVRVSAVGYGASSSADGYTPGQRRLLAMRASKLDAYRALAEQVYGVRVSGNSTVASIMSQNDSFRVYLDAFLRGARVVSVTPMADGNYETVLELDLDDRFFQTFAPQPGATMPSNPYPVASTLRGGVGAGNAYGSDFYYSE